MAFTKIAAAGIGSTETVTLHSLEVLNNATVGGVLTYEDVTNVDSIGIVTARAGVLVGSGITLSKDGDIFATGISTISVINSDKISLGDNEFIHIGIGSDLRFSHDSNNSIITNSTGELLINSPIINLRDTSNTSRFRIEPAGNVNIAKNLNVSGLTTTGIISAFTNTNGTTDLLTLHADADGTNDGMASIKFVGNAGNHSAFIKGGHMTNGDTILTFHTDDYSSGFNPEERVRINHAGKVGIGTTGSDYALSIREADNNNKFLMLQKNSGQELLQIREDGSNHIIIDGSHASGELHFYTAGVERVKIASDGKLFTTRTHSSTNTGNHPALDIDTYSNNGSPQAAMATGIDFSVEGVHKKRLAVTYADSSAGTGDWIFYRDQGNNTGMKITSAGYVTKPSQPCFRAGRSTAVTPGSQSTIVFNLDSGGLHFNQGSHYDNSTGAFTAPIAGIYYFYCQVLWQGLSDGQNMDDAFYMHYNSSGGASGGSLVTYDARRSEYVANTTGNAGYYGAHSSVMVNMAQGGSVFVINNRAGITVHGNANFTFFQGYLIG